MSIIGREYLPIDNSYSVNLTKPTVYDKRFGQTENKKYLAGTSRSDPQLCIIRSLPIKILIDITVSTNNFKQIPMVIVEVVETGEFHLVMYFKNGLKIQERLEAIEAHKELNKR